MTHADQWTGRAALARSMGDLATAGWCEEQAEYHRRKDAHDAHLASLDDACNCTPNGADHARA